MHTIRSFPTTAAWRSFGGKRCYFRSSWEANYGRYLQWIKERGEIKDWRHEPYTFWFHGVDRGCVSYLPDFKVLKDDNSHYWVEVKGYMDPKSKTKLSRMKKFYPDELVYVVDKNWFKANQILSGIIPGWES